jgi:hypothetical protein
LEKAKGEREMKINVNVEVPDEEYCDRCDYLLNFTDIDELHCMLFDVRLKRDKAFIAVVNKCLDCLNATRVEVEE